MLRIVCAFAFLLCSLQALADRLDTLWVIDSGDSGTGEVGEVEHSEFTGSHSHIGRSRLADESSSLGRVIARESGVQLRQSGGEGTYSTLTVRAAGSVQTDVYLDGVLLNNAGSGGVDLAQLELLNIGSVDIYRGATPVQLGVGNLGGAVNIRGLQSDGTVTRLLLGSGSFNSQRLQLSHQLNPDLQDSPWDASLALTHQQSDNRFLFTNDNGTPLNTADDSRQKRHNGQFERDSLWLKFGRRSASANRLDGLLQVTRRHQGIPHFRNSADNQASLDTDSVQFQLNQRLQAADTDNWNLLTGLFVNRNDERYDDSLGQIGLGAQNTRASTDVLGARAYWEHIGSQGTFAINTELRSDALQQRDLLGGGDFQASRDALSSTLQYSLFRRDDTLLLTPALRIRSLRDQYDGVLRQGSDRRSDSTIHAQLGARLERQPGRAWTFNLGQYSREPVFQELFGDRGLFIGNDTLVAEQGLNIDAGWHWRADHNSRRSMDFTLFASLRDELIVTTYDARGVGRNENTGKARIVGLESSIDWAWSERWSSRLNLTLQSAENLSDNAAYNGRQLAGEARIAAFATLRYQRDRRSAWLAADFLSERFYDTANILPADARLILDSGFSYRRGNYESRLQILNLGDEHTEDFNGFPRPGRSFRFSLSYRF